MSRKRILLLSSLLGLISFLSGAYVSYILLLKGIEKAVANHILSIRIPTEEKEITLLSGIARGLDTASPAETRKHICRLIGIKVAGLKDFVGEFAKPNAPVIEESLKTVWFGEIAIAEKMAVSAGCRSESGSNNLVERGASPINGSRTSP